AGMRQWGVFFASGARPRVDRRLARFAPPGLLAAAGVGVVGDALGELLQLLERVADRLAIDLAALHGLPAAADIVHEQQLRELLLVLVGRGRDDDRRYAVGRLAHALLADLLAQGRGADDVAGHGREQLGVGEIDLLLLLARPRLLTEAAVARPLAARRNHILIRLVAGRRKTGHAVRHAGIGRCNGKEPREDQGKLDWHGTAS